MDSDLSIIQMNRLWYRLCKVNTRDDSGNEELINHPYLSDDGYEVT